MTRLTSRRHPLVATCRLISGGRAEPTDLMLLDGAHLVAEALAAGVRLRTVAFTGRAIATGEGARLAGLLASRMVEIVEVSESVMEAMSPVASPSGIIAIAVRPDASLARTLDRAPQLVVVAVGVQEPGNVGAIVRAAEACGATGAVFCGASADPFGWKALRGSMGSALRLPLSAGVSADAALAAARTVGIRVFATVPAGGMRPDAVDFRRPAALLVGGEGHGLPDQIVAAADDRVSIPMRPPVESLNVAVAVALLAYEAARQRGVL